MLIAVLSMSGPSSIPAAVSEVHAKQHTIYYKALSMDTTLVPVRPTAKGLGTPETHHMSVGLCQGGTPVTRVIAAYLYVKGFAHWVVSADALGISIDGIHIFCKHRFKRYDDYKKST